MPQRPERGDKIITSESLRQEGYTLLTDHANPDGLRVRQMDSGEEGMVTRHGQSDDLNDQDSYYWIKWDRGGESIFKDISDNTDHIVMIENDK